MLSTKFVAERSRASRSKSPASECPFFGGKKRKAGYHPRIPIQGKSKQKCNTTLVLPLLSSIRLINPHSHGILKSKRQISPNARFNQTLLGHPHSFTCA